MATGFPSTSLVLLMFNEEPNINAALDETLDWARGRLEDWEVIVIDDGSTDGGPAIVEQRAQTEPRLRLIRHDRNRGMGAGMASGVRAATCDYVVVMASDLQVPVAELEKLYALLDRAEVILTVYGNRPNSLARTVMSRGFRLYMRLLAGIRFQLESFVLMPTALAQELLPSMDCDTFFFSFEIAQRAIEKGHRTATATISSRPRAAGESKVANTGRIRRVAQEVWAYRQRRRREG